MTYGLRPRPEPPAEDMAAVVAAAQALLRPSVISEDVVDTPAWRFSGRWFGGAKRRS